MILFDEFTVGTDHNKAAQYFKPTDKLRVAVTWPSNKNFNLYLINHF